MNDQKESIEISHLLRNAPVGQETVFDLADKFVDEKPCKGISISRRQLNPEPKKEPDIVRARKRSHTFNSIDLFCEYLSEGAIALADIDKMEIGAVLDEGSGIEQEIVTFIPKIHPLFEPWNELLDKPVPVVEFAMHCMKYRRTVLDPDGLELAHMMSQIKASKAITRHSGVGKKSLNGVMVELEISGERKGAPVELPDSIVIECPIFIDSEPVRVELDLLVTEMRDQIVAFITSSSVEIAKVEAFKQFVEELKNDSDARAGFGQVRLTGWAIP